MKISKLGNGKVKLTIAIPSKSVKFLEALWGPHEVTRNPEDTKSLIETIRAIPNIKTEEDLQVTKGFLTYYLSFVGPVHSAIFF